MIVYALFAADTSVKRGQGSIRKGEALRLSNLNLKRKQRGRGRKPKGRRLRRWGSHCEARRRNGEKKNRRLSTGIGRKAWKQAGRKRKAAPEEPPTGETGKKGKERRKAE